MTTEVCRALVLVVGVIAASASSAAAAAPSPTPSPLCCVPSGPVRAIAVSGKTAYVGGSFRHVGPLTGSIATVDTTAGQLKRRWPQIEGTVSAIAGDGSGGWYVAGSFAEVGGVPRGNLAHLRSDGTLDPAWAASANGSVNAIAVFGGRVYVGGQFTQVNGSIPRSGLAAFDRTTGAVTSVGDAGGANGAVHAFAVRPGGTNAGDAPARLYVGGQFTQIDGQPRGRIASYDINHALTSTWAGTGFNGLVRTMVEVNRGTQLLPIWQLYVGGDFTLFGPSTARKSLAAFDEAGVITPWAPTIPSDPGGVSYALTVAAGGSRIYVGGVSGLRAFERTGAGAASGWAPDLGVFASARTLAVSGDTVYVGGTLFQVGGDVRRSNAAAFSTIDASVVRAWDPEPSGNEGVSALAFDNDGGIAVAGRFATAGGTPRHGIAAFDLQTGALLPFDPDVERDVTHLAVAGGRLYAAGSFTQVNGATPRLRVAAFDLASGAVRPFAPAPNGQVTALAATATTVFLAGSFTNVNGGVPRDSIAALDAETGAARDFQPAHSFFADSFAIRDADVFMGGSFKSMAGAARDNLAVVRDVPGTVGVATFFDPKVDGFVNSIVLDGDRLYAGGQFDNAGTPPVARRRVGAFDTGSGAAVAWDASVGGLVSDLAKAGDAIVAGGAITTANGQPRGNIAAFRTGAGGLLDWAPAIDQYVEALAASPEAGLVVGGSFANVDGKLNGPLVAFALPPTAPGAPAATPQRDSATVTVPAPPSGGAAITSYTVTASPGGRTATGPGPALAVTGLTTNQPYTFTATATNRVGTSPASPPSNAVAPGAAPGSVPVTRPADRTAPTIGGLRLTNRRFRLGSRATAKSARAAAGTEFRFTLSELATTTVTVERARPGRRSGKRCVAPRARLRKRCTRYTAVHALTRRSRSGANRIAYSGRVGARRLAPGQYRATLVARDAAGNRSRPAQVRFTVVRR